MKNCVFIFIIIKLSNSKGPDVEGLGLLIKKTLLNPSGKAIDLISNIYEYYEELEEVLKNIKEGKPEGIQKYLLIKHQGGPPHLQEPVDSETLIDYYHWKSYETFEFHSFMNFTKHTWDKIRVEGDKSLNIS